MVSPCSPHLRAWRRLTRLDAAVAVPATTAVRAMAPMSPGIAVLLSVGRFGGVERGDQVFDRDPRVGDQLSAVAANGRGERRGPAVFEDDHHCRGACLDDVGSPLQVVIA